MKSLDDKEELPLFYKIADNKVNSKAVAPVRPKLSGAVSLKPEVNALQEEFNAMLTSVDGKVLIKPSKHQLFVNFLHRPQLTWYMRIFILNCIPGLPSADKTMLVTLAERKGLHAFQHWLKLASDRTSDAEKFQLDILKALEALPVDMAALRQVPIGKTVNGLAKKDPSQKVKAAAAKVVQQWRRNVGMTDNDAKRVRLLSQSTIFLLCCCLFTTLSIVTGTVLRSYKSLVVSKSITIAYRVYHRAFVTCVVGHCICIL